MGPFLLYKQTLTATCTKIKYQSFNVLPCTRTRYLNYTPITRQMSDTSDSWYSRTLSATGHNNSKNYEVGWIKVKLVCQWRVPVLNHGLNHIICMGSFAMTYTTIHVLQYVDFVTPIIFTKTKVYPSFLFKESISIIAWAQLQKLFKAYCQASHSLCNLLASSKSNMGKPHRSSSSYGSP